jgi:GcrA cell cycle regulator
MIMVLIDDAGLHSDHPSHTTLKRADHLPEPYSSIDLNAFVLSARQMQTLLEMHHAGASYSEIAKAVGGITKNSVAGYASRLKLPSMADRKKSGPNTAPSKPRRKRISQSATSRPARIEDGARSASRSPHRPCGNDIDRGDQKTPRRRMVYLATEISGDTCTWPIGDPRSTEFRFCGKNAQPGRPYCADHCAAGSGGRVDLKKMKWVYRQR